MLEWVGKPLGLFSVFMLCLLLLKHFCFVLNSEWKSVRRYRMLHKCLLGIYYISGPVDQQGVIQHGHWRFGLVREENY